MPGPADTYIAYGRNWANVSNTPFREYKSSNHEGGIATPLIAHWPKGIAARNELRHEPGHLIDIMATCVELSGAEYPARFADHDILPMEGRSLAGGFAADRKEERTLLFEHFGRAAIRKGTVEAGARRRHAALGTLRDRGGPHRAQRSQQRAPGEGARAGRIVGEGSQADLHLSKARGEKETLKSQTFFFHDFHTGDALEILRKIKGVIR
jgi:hypothetical protein